MNECMSRQPLRRRSMAPALGFMAWGALWAYGGGPAGFVIDLAHELAAFARGGVTLHAGRDAVDLHLGL